MHSDDRERYYLDTINCPHSAASKTVRSTKVNFYKHWLTEELDQLKAECTKATLWRQFGCPRLGDINSYRIRAKLKYKKCRKTCCPEC